MIKYILAAQALKAFSAGAPMRSLYRQLGNHTGGKARSRTINPSYIKRADDNLAFLERHQAIRDGMAIVELGTGWVHWESLYTRLFYDVDITLFDVWDNRQFNGFLHYAKSLREQLASQARRPADQIRRAEGILDDILLKTSFDDVYRSLNFTYLTNPHGALEDIKNDSIDIIISSDVLEHVNAQAVPTLMNDMMRVLKKGGISSHHVVPSDHLCIYDKSANGKNYLRYSDRIWNLFFQNEVQYFNRIQFSEWREAFINAGFVILEEAIVARADISGLKIDPRFASMSQDDLECTVFRMAATKSLTTADR